MTRPLSNTERRQLREAFELWNNIIATLISLLTVTTEKETKQIPQAVDIWANQIVDQLHTDSVMRNDGGAIAP